MKKTIITASVIISAIIAIAQKQVWLYQSDGTRYGYEYSTFDSITYVAPGTIALSQSSRIVPCEGEQFQLEIVTNMPWTAMVSDNNLIKLSKQKGSVGKDTVTVNIGVNKESSYKYNDITFKLTDGTTSAISIISKDWQDKLSVSPALKAVLPLGGTYKMYITSDTNWTVSASEPWVTFDKTKGALNDSIVVTVGRGDKDAARAEITITTSNGKTATCTVIHDGDNVSVSPYSKTLPPVGGTFKIGVASNTDWTVSASGPWVTFDKTKGTLNDSIVVTVAKSENVESTSATIAITTLNGKTTQCGIAREGDKISVNLINRKIGFEGGTINMAVTSNTEWTASSNKSWTTLSASFGRGNGTIAVTASEDKSLKVDTAVVTLTTALGKVASTPIIRSGIEKCKASDYLQVTIGTQVWMAENYRCSMYDTQSEAYNASWLTNNTIPTSDNRVHYIPYYPYYTDASDKSKWAHDDYAGNLTDAQIAKFGYLYNWAAAVGVADGREQTTEFTGNRQGICPNGWHIPSRAEWQTLVDYIEKTDGKGADTAGKHLKTTSGWYNGDYRCKLGLDTYGFAALPSAHASGSSVDFVGYDTFFWAATLDEDKSSIIACGISLNCFKDVLYSSSTGKKYGRSVRCLRD